MPSSAIPLSAGHCFGQYFLLSLVHLPYESCAVRQGPPAPYVDLPGGSSPKDGPGPYLVQVMDGGGQPVLQGSTGPVTIISLAAPYGCLEAQKFWSTLLATRLFRAIFARPNDPILPPAIIVSDEAQDFLQGMPAAAEVEKALAQSRSRKTSIWLACQQFAQLEAASPTLAKALRSNCNLQVLMRASPEDARAMRHILPISGRFPKPTPAPWEKPTGPVLSHAEEEKFLLDEISRLPDRLGWWWDRRQPWRAVKFQTRDVDIPANVEIAEEMQQHLRLGSPTMTIQELEKCETEEQQKLARLMRQPETEDKETLKARSSRSCNDLPNLG